MRWLGWRRILFGRQAPREGTVTSTARFEEIQRQEVSRIFGLFTQARVAGIPLLVAFLAWTVWQDPAPWRLVLIGVATPAFVAIFIQEYRRYRARGMSRHALDRNLAIGVAGITLINVVSGGLDSPFLLVYVPVTVVIGVLASPAAATWLLVSEVAVVWLFAVLELTDGARGLHLRSLGTQIPLIPARIVVVAAAYTVVLVGARFLGRFLRRTFDAMLRRTIAAQDESLSAHAERAAELTALSAEIAHELKNPLASVKGLAGLLSQSLCEGKGSERLAVLRREVDRMQVILDEFLNYSRPLVPLALGHHDVGALCHEVAALHEGMAQERGVALEVTVPPLSARCDPRKVKQVLINLVQNALDVAPRGSAVTLTGEAAEGGGCVLRVLDRGRGLEPGLGARVFEPGVTTKPAGSGLGLTIARSLARQHGGDLALEARAGGGTAAVLRLPGAPPPDAAGRGGFGCGAAA
jgi:signal transduction histidine kinase